MLNNIHMFERRVLHMNSLYRNIFRVISFIVIGSLSFVALASTYPKSERDFSLLPPYCKAKLGGRNAGWKAWEARLRGFGHVHHYCAALHTVKLANRETVPIRRRYHLDSTIGGFEYMERHAPKSQLMPEIMTQKGKVLLRLKRESEAMAAFQKAIMIKKDYAPAYIAIADYYISLGSTKNAKDIINQGLKYAPSSKGLKRRLDKVS